MVKVPDWVYDAKEGYSSINLNLTPEGYVLIDNSIFENEGIERQGKNEMLWTRLDMPDVEIDGSFIQEVVDSRVQSNQEYAYRIIEFDKKMVDGQWKNISSAFSKIGIIEIPDLTLVEETLKENDVNRIFHLINHMNELEFRIYFARILKKNYFYDLKMVQNRNSKCFIAYRDGIKHVFMCLSSDTDKENFIVATNEITVERIENDCHVSVIVINKDFGNDTPTWHARDLKVVLWQHDIIERFVSNKE